MSDKEKHSDEGVWKLANQLAAKVNGKQAAIILILLVIIYGSANFVDALSPFFAANPNMLVILAVVVICVSGYLALRAMEFVTRTNTTHKTTTGAPYSCQTKGCSETFQASRPDGHHIFNSTNRNIRKNPVQRTYICKKGHENTLFWYSYYDE